MSASAAKGANSGRGVAVGFTSGKLTGKLNTDRLDFDAYDNSLTVEELFGSLDGGPLVDAVCEFYKDSEHTVSWFHQDARGNDQRSLTRSAFSRELQEDTVSAYKTRILHEGLSQRVAGLQTTLITTGNHTSTLVTLTLIFPSQRQSQVLF